MNSGVRRGGGAGNIKIWILAIGLACSAVLLVLIGRAAVDVPFQDELTFGSLYRFIAEGKFPSLSELVAAHHGHPYFLVKLLIFSTLIAHLPWSWMMYAQVPLLMLSFSVASIRLSGKASVGGIVAVAGLAMTVMTPRQWENLYWAMQIGFPIWLASSLGAFYFVDRYGREKKMYWLASALALALLATMNTGAGIFTLLLTTLGLLFTCPKYSAQNVAPLLFVLVIGVGMWTISLALASKGGIGGNPLSLPIALEHVVRMSAHTVFDFTQANPMGIGKYAARITLLALGIAIIVLVGFCSWRGIGMWPDSVFEILSMALGVVLILAVTYARVKQNIFQPDASRYLVFLMPIVIGCLMLLWRLNMNRLLIVLVGLIAIGYVMSVVSEWAVTPYRKANLKGVYIRLCNEGKAGMPLSVKGVKDIQTLFCNSG